MSSDVPRTRSMIRWLKNSGEMQLVWDQHFMTPLVSTFLLKKLSDAISSAFLIYLTPLVGTLIKALVSDATHTHLFRHFCGSASEKWTFSLRNMDSSNHNGIMTALSEEMERWVSYLWKDQQLNLSLKFCKFYSFSTTEKQGE